jgi:hypothetical protein
MALYDGLSTYDSFVTYDESSESAEPTNRMKKIKVGVSKLRPADTAQHADNLVEQLTGNVHVPTPDPPLPTLTDGAQAIRDKEIEIEAKKGELDVLRMQLAGLNDTLKDDIRKLADHVEDKCDGNEEFLRSTGFALIGDPEPRGPVGQVQNLRVQSSDMEGQLGLRWKRTPGAFHYVVDMATSADGPWTSTVATTSRTTHTMHELTPGQKYWFRVRAFNTLGYGPWSDPACKMAA